MSFIDWSDSEGMFGLLLEYISDAINECGNDIERKNFLRGLQLDLAKLDDFNSLSSQKAAHRLRSIYTSINDDFRDDPVSDHLRDCIEELEAI